MLIHLHTHSSYSFLEALPSPAGLVQAAVDLGMPALALTDHNRLSGAIEFYAACREAGIQPLLGLELDVIPPPGLSAYTAGISYAAGSARPTSLVLLAQDLQGWSALCRLASLAQSDSAGARPILFDHLTADSTGLICLTGGLRGLASALATGNGARPLDLWLGRLHEAFPSRLYVELQLQSPSDLPQIERLAQAAEHLRLPTVAAQSLYYLTPDQAALQRTLAAMRLNRPVGSLDEADLAPPASHFASPADLEARFAAYPAALDATREIADRCNLELPLGVARFPRLELPGGQTPIQALRQKAQAGALRLYGPDPAVQSRLEHELAVIEQFGYEALFLVMEEIVGFARQSGIPIASRGSASSSLAAHCLGITTPDPVRLNLYFERFLNPARRTPPDIDTDLCSRRRDEVIDFVYRRFGADRVAMVCTVNRFRRRSALREVAKAHGLPPAQVGELAESLPQRWYGPPDRFQSDDAPFAELARRYTSPLHQLIFNQAQALIGLPRHLSVHPGGVVISPAQMTDLTPTQLAAKGMLITQFDLESIERLGLVKIDLLGIRGLTVLGDVAQALVAGAAESPSSPMKQRPGRSIPGQVYDRRLELLDGIPEDDPLTAEMVERGRTIGCFQIESPGMRATLKEVHARTVDDIMAALALYRPGPLTGGLKDAFVARYRGLESVSYPHPALQPLLQDTYGVILYQEQVLRIAHELAGFSLAEADLLRRAMSHFDPGKQMQVLQQRFVAGAYERGGVPEPVAGRIWEMMAAFAGYGFPKAHAASYARLSWQSAWCKTHHPALFMAAVLANWGGYYSQRVYLTEARRMGLALRPPQVNYAVPEFSVRYLDGAPVLFMGLNQVRELTRRTQGRILRYRPFTSFMDFLARADPRPQEAENLVRAGALEGFGTIPALLRQLERGGWRGGQLPLFALETPSGEDWTLAEKAAAQEALLGAGLAAHPLELQADRIASSGALTTVEAAAKLGQRVRVAGMRQTWRRSRTTAGDYIYFMALEDLEGMLDVVILGEVYRRNRSALSGPGPYVLEGVVEFDQEKGEPFIRLERLWQVGG
jgi:DNA-directed DNA polymerase III PolC